MEEQNNRVNQDNKINRKEAENKVEKDSTKIEDDYPLLSINDEEYIDYHFYNPDFKAFFTVHDFKNKFINFESDVNLVEVEFKCSRRKIFNNCDKLNIDISEFVIVEVDNGIDLGTVTAIGKKALERYRTIYKNDHEITKVLRHATEDDLIRYRKNLKEESEIAENTRKIIKQYHLDMKICEAEWQLDRQRLTIYFTAPQRIDFRELVKELAKVFKTRIELRQISSREEAKRLGGIGPCGLCLCCKNISSENCHVTLDHARLQQLANNVAKLSGYCGRLKCCLLYEHHNYLECFKKYPPLESIIELSEGTARLVKIDIFKDKSYLLIDSTGTYLTLNYEELEKLQLEGKIKFPEKHPQSMETKEEFNFTDDLLGAEFLETDF